MKNPVYCSVSIMLSTLALAQTVHAAEVSNQLEINGSLEAAYSASSGDSPHDYGTAFSKGKLETILKPTEQFNVNTSFLYEEDLHNVKTPVGLDEANATTHLLADNKLNLTAGRKYLKFGTFESKMVSDPLPLELGETRRNAVLEASSKQGNITATGYAFGGTAPKLDAEGKYKNGYGFSVGYVAEKAGIGADFMSNLAESNHFDNKALDKKIPAMSLHGNAQLANITLRAEHLAATKAFQPGDLGGGISTSAKPSATQLESDLDLQKDRTIALAWDKTSNAAEIDLPKQNLGAAYQQPIYKNLKGGVEVMQTKDYEGAKDKVLNVKLAYEF